MSAAQAPRSAVPRDVETELERVVRRWRQLPLDHALTYAARVRALVQSLADEVSAAHGIPATQVPDWGPATLMDQLTVMVYDLMVYELRVQKGTEEVQRSARSTRLAQELATLRRELG